MLLCSRTGYSAYRACSNGVSPETRSKLFMSWNCMQKLVWMDVTWLDWVFSVPGLCLVWLGTALPPEVNFGWGSCSTVHLGQLPVGEGNRGKLLARGWHGRALLPWQPPRSACRIPGKAASHYAFQDPEVKLQFFVLSGCTFIGLFCVFLTEPLGSISRCCLLLFFLRFPSRLPPERRRAQPSEG